MQASAAWGNQKLLKRLEYYLKQNLSYAFIAKKLGQEFTHRTFSKDSIRTASNKYFPELVANRNTKPFVPQNNPRYIWNKETIKLLKRELSRSKDRRDLTKTMSNLLGRKLSLESVEHALHRYIEPEYLVKYSKKNTPTVWTKDAIDAMKKLVKDGKNSREISKILTDKMKQRISISSVQSAYRQFLTEDERPSTLIKQRTFWTPEVLELIKTRLAEGRGAVVITREINNKFNVKYDPETVRRVIDKNMGKKMYREGDYVRNNVWSKARVDYLRELVAGGLSDKEAAIKMREKFDVPLSEEQVKRGKFKYLSEEEVNKGKLELRKRSVGVEVDEEGLSESELIRSIDYEKDVERWRMKYNRLEQKFKFALRDQIFQENILSIVKENILSLDPVPVPEKVKIEDDEEKSKETVVLVVSDAHIGEVVSKEETGGINHYDFDTFRYRLQYLCDATIRITKHRLSGYDLRKIVVIFNGDMVTGMIHEELVESGEDTVIEWCQGGALVFAQFLQELAREFDEVECVCVIGNHGRLKPKPQFKHRYVNWDYVLYHELSLMLINQKNIKFIIPKSFYVLHKIEGHQFLIMHGDNIRSWASIPWYGIERAAAKLNELLSQNADQIDYIVLGHFHHTGDLDRVHGGQIILNGSMVGGNEYSIGKLFVSSRPKQTLFCVHPRKGKTLSFNIDLDFAREDIPIRYQYNKSELLNQQTYSLIMANGMEDADDDGE